MGEPRVALVTGGSSGIGRALCESFGAQGWKVGIGSRRDEQRDACAEVLAGRGVDVHASRLDVTDATSVDGWFDACMQALGPADLVVSNAGVAVIGTLEETTPEDHRRVVDTNLLGPILVARRAIDAMRGRSGDLVFISSDSTRHPRPRLASYAAAKAGVEQLARTLALELEGSGIRTTTVRVGPTVTDFAASWDPTGFADLMQYWSNFGLTRREGILEPAQVAEAVTRIVSLPHGTTVHEFDVHATDPT